jgi:hypothetical protein
VIGRDPLADVALKLGRHRVPSARGGGDDRRRRPEPISVPANGTSLNGERLAAAAPAPPAAHRRPAALRDTELAVAGRPMGARSIGAHEDTRSPER